MSKVGSLILGTSENTKQKLKQNHYQQYIILAIDFIYLSLPSPVCLSIHQPVCHTVSQSINQLKK